MTAPPPGTLIFSAPTGWTLRSAPKIEEVYLEAQTRLAAAAQLAQAYLEAQSRQAAKARLNQVYLEVWTRVRPPPRPRPLRLMQRDDGLGVEQHARLQAGSLPGAATSTQLGQVPRIGTNNRYS